MLASITLGRNRCRESSINPNWLIRLICILARSDFTTSRIFLSIACWFLFSYISIKSITTNPAKSRSFNCLAIPLLLLNLSLGQFLQCCVLWSIVLSLHPRPPRLLFDLRRYSLQILAEPLAHRGSPIVFLFNLLKIGTLPENLCTRFAWLGIRFS